VSGTVTLTWADGRAVAGRVPCHGGQRLGAGRGVVVPRKPSRGCRVLRAEVAPSSLNWTPATATLSEAGRRDGNGAGHRRAFAGAVSATVGRVVSGTVTLTGADVALLPAASRATAVSTCAPGAAVAVFQDTE